MFLAPVERLLQLGPIRHGNSGFAPDFGRGISVADFRVMNAGRYRVVQVLSVTAMLGAELFLSFVLIWLIKGHGVVSCGMGIFDDPNWLLYVVVLLAIPLGVIAAGVTLFLWCSSRRL